MGVSGSGKTTIAQEIASQLDIVFLDADFFHSEAAIKQMSQGTPLTDEQRKPWIERICIKLSQLELNGESCVLAYSGLKQQHRQLIFGSYPRSFGILLNADQTLIVQRMADRKGHFMPPQLLDSQMAAMEPVNENMDEKIRLLTISATEPIDSMLMKSIEFIFLDT